MKKARKLEGLKTVGDRIRAWRKAIPLTARDLAKLLNISQASMSEIETNKCLPSASTIAALMTETDIDIFYILTGKLKKGDKNVTERPYQISFDKRGLVITPGDEIKRIIIARE